MLKYFDSYKRAKIDRWTRLPFGHFDNPPKQAQPFSQFLPKCSFPSNQISKSAFTWILKILNIIKSFWGKLHYNHGRWAHLGKIWMNVKSGHQQSSNQVAKRLKSCVYKFYSCINLKIIFQNTRRIKFYFPYKDRLNRSQMSRIIYKAGCWDCNEFYIGKTKRRLHDRKTEHFKTLSKCGHTSAIADHMNTTGHWFKNYNHLWMLT